MTGCGADEEVISGGVSEVIAQLLDKPVDGSYKVEVTGYILDSVPVSELYGEDHPRATLDVYDGQEESDGFIIAVFDDKEKDDLEEVLEEGIDSESPVNRVTISGTCDGGDVGSYFTTVYNCSIAFEKR